MFADTEWLMKQERINEQLRQRAEEQARRANSERPGLLAIRTLAGKKALQRTFDSARRLHPTGGSR